MSEELENKYIVCLGNEGYEAMYNITGLAEEEVLSKLKGIDSDRLKNFAQFLSGMRMRIRMNHHRDIKSYIITSDIDEDTFRNSFCEDYLCEYVRNTHEPMKRL